MAASTSFHTESAATCMVSAHVRNVCQALSSQFLICSTYSYLLMLLMRCQLVMFKETQQGHSTISQVAAVITCVCLKIHSIKTTLMVIKDIPEQSSGCHTDSAVAITSSPRTTSTQI